AVEQARGCQLGNLGGIGGVDEELHGRAPLWLRVNGRGYSGAGPRRPDRTRAVLRRRAGERADRRKAGQSPPIRTVRPAHPPSGSPMTFDLSAYRRQWFADGTAARRDILAGIVVALALIPEA